MACGVGGGGTTEPANGVPAGALEISMLYGSEKRVWIDEVTAQFNAQQVKSSSGKPIFVTTTPVGSADSMNQILDGRAQPTIWSPASAVLVPLANQRWAQANAGAQLVEGTPPPLVLSPVVIAMWEPMAKALGWPQTLIGWGDIAELATSGKTWADYGHPEWGPFQFGHTHPDYSNSGIVSILATAYAATGKTRGLTVADVQQPETAEFMRKVESGVIHYGESTGFFGEQMFNRGPGYLSAAVLYENLVVQSRDRSRYPNLSTQVVAIYPKEGTFWSDHPYAILNAPWVDAEKRAAAEAYRDFLLARPQQEAALKFGFRPGDPNVPVGEPITVANGVDPTQPQTLLEVPSADVIDAVRAVWGQNKKRVDVMAVLDVSGSMSEENRMEQAKGALKTFVEQLAEEDGFGLTIFNSTSTVVSEISPLGPKRQQMLDTVGGLFPDGGTRLYDTVVEAYSALQAEPAGERIRAVVVLTDGEDTDSVRSLEQLVQEIQRDAEGRSIKVFTIAFGGTANVEVVKQIAEATGAKSYQADDAAAIERVYRDIATFF
ncbi:MAG: substrate-binding domain-containing protein [Roseiflexaceae bacterium]|nr:substrate-binding domain-containing protein [Roseiflexaceae bacterium]